MINANEARIVTNENEYKEILRQVEAARAARAAAIEREKQTKEMLNNLLNPIGEAIAQQAAEGYSNLQIYIYNSTYTDKSYLAYNIDVAKCEYCLRRITYVIDYVPILANIIVDCLKTLGYKVVPDNAKDRSYSSTRKIMISW